jgi:YHS domain-containing protein/ElaB/YqjD/DUF883 family membrane-anchored ribosome-binding protein
MGKDPVCHEEADERSGWSSSYQDKTYYFNSAECKADFDKDPGRYASAAISGGGQEAGARREAEGGRASSRARSRIQSVITDRKDKAAERIGTVSSAFRTVSQQLRDQNQEAIARYAERTADNVDQVSAYLQQHDAEQILNEAEDFVRRRPALLIGSAFAAGFLMARFLKSSRSVSA